eukprot:1159302-Pelagomonas_calceolata.AAC.20
MCLHVNHSRCRQIWLCSSEGKKERKKEKRNTTCFYSAIRSGDRCQSRCLHDPKKQDRVTYYYLPTRVTREEGLSQDVRVLACLKGSLTEAKGAFAHPPLPLAFHFFCPVAAAATVEGGKCWCWTGAGTSLLSMMRLRLGVADGVAFAVVDGCAGTALAATPAAIKYFFPTLLQTASPLFIRYANNLFTLRSKSNTFKEMCAIAKYQANHANNSAADSGISAGL